MNNPFFWLGVSILLVAISLMALLTVAIFTLQELARAARSAEKLLDTLNQELPATLKDLRLTGQELSGLTDEVTGSVQSARSVVEQVDQSLTEVKVHAQKAQITTRSLWAGATAALQVLAGSKPRRRRRPPTRRPPVRTAIEGKTKGNAKNELPTKTKDNAQSETEDNAENKTQANSQKLVPASTTDKSAPTPPPRIKTDATPVIPASQDIEMRP